MGQPSKLTSFESTTLEQSGSSSVVWIPNDARIVPSIPKCSTTDDGAFLVRRPAIEADRPKPVDGRAHSDDGRDVGRSGFEAMRHVKIGRGLGKADGEEPVPPALPRRHRLTQRTPSLKHTGARGLLHFVCRKNAESPPIEPTSTQRCGPASAPSTTEIAPAIRTIEHVS